MTTRGEFITGLRQLADFLTVNPSVAVPPYSTQIQISTLDGDDANCRAVDAFALASGAEPVWNPEGVHYKALLQFGPIEYYILAVTESHMADYREANRLGEAALAAKKAREEIERHNAELAERLPYGTAVTYRGDPWRITWTGVADNGEDRCEIELAGTLTGPRETVRVDEVEIAEKTPLAVGDRVTNPAGVAGRVSALGPCGEPGCDGNVRFLMADFPDDSHNFMCYRTGDLRPIERTEAVASR